MFGEGLSFLVQKVTLSINKSAAYLLHIATIRQQHPLSATVLFTAKNDELGRRFDHVTAHPVFTSYCTGGGGGGLNPPSSRNFKSDTVYQEFQKASLSPTWRKELNKCHQTRDQMAESKSKEIQL